MPIDKCSKTCSQYANPTNINNSSLCVEYGVSHAVYSFNDFGLPNLHEVWEENMMSYVPKERPLTVSQWLINDYKLLSEDDFLAKYGARYHYFKRNVNHCFELSLEEIVQKYSHNISYLKSKAPRRKIIYKYARGMNLAQKAECNP